MIMKSLIRKLVIGIFMCVILVSITSCIGTDATITIKNDGSGTIQLSYTISKLIAHLGKLEETDSSVPLPVGREDFNRTVQRTTGLVLEKYKESEDEENVIVDAEMTFSSVSSLNEFLNGKEEEVIRLEQNAGTSTLVFEIYAARESELTESNAEVLSEMFQGYNLNFTVKTPDIVERHNLGTQSSDGKSVNLQLPVSRLLTENEPVIWEISW